MTRGATPVRHGRGPLSAPRSGWESVSPDSGLLSDAAAEVPAEVAAKAASENFPVALRLLPGRYRCHLMAVYRFARTVDDIGDEPQEPQGPQEPQESLAAHRLRLLDALEEDITRLYAGTPPASEVIGQLAATVTECALPAELLRDLIQANRQDQHMTRYPTFEDLLAYCRLSANPVGRIVLHVFGAATPAREALSDHVCTALQLAEHWQDVAEDYQGGRVYLPQEDLDRFGCTEADLAEPTAGQHVRALMAFQVARARALLDAGAPLTGTLRGAARLAVAGYVAGGRAALQAIEAAGYDVLAATPRPDKRRRAATLAVTYLRGR